MADREVALMMEYVRPDLPEGVDYYDVGGQTIFPWPEGGEVFYLQTIPKFPGAQTFAQRFIVPESPSDVVSTVLKAADEFKAKLNEVSHA